MRHSSKMFKMMLVGATVAPLLLLSNPSLAVDIGLGKNGMAQNIAGKAGFDTNTTKTTLSESVGRIIRVVLSLIGTGFLALTIYAGVLWMTASGNEEQVESATKILKAATIGLIIVVSAYGITVFFLAATLGAAGTSQSTVGGTGTGSVGFWKSFYQYLRAIPNQFDQP